MLNIELIRQNPSCISGALNRRGEETDIERVLAIDERRREAQTKANNASETRNGSSKFFAFLKRIAQNKDKVTADDYNEPIPPQISQYIGKSSIQELLEMPSETLLEQAQNAMREISKEADELVREASVLDVELHELLLTIPNIPLQDVPSGYDESSNIVVRTCGNPKTFEFTPLAHWDLGERLGIIDIPRGSKISGSRFFTLMGQGASLQRALISWMIDWHVQHGSFKEVYVPFLVRKETMLGSGNLPKFEENLYHDLEDDLWLIPTAEVPLTGLHKDEILDASSLPIYYVAHTPSFRREKAAAGKDTRGIKRVHQFDKVELYKIVSPESSNTELDKLVQNAEGICQHLDIPYRLIQLCAGDMSFPSAKSFDLEMWAPGCQEWLEVSSCSNCTDFQARRANIRYRPKAGDRPAFVHTLNGSGLALPRVLIAIIENYQQSDGSILVPEVLQPYMNQKVISNLLV